MKTRQPPPQHGKGKTKPDVDAPVRQADIDAGRLVLRRAFAAEVAAMHKTMPVTEPVIEQLSRGARY